VPVWSSDWFYPRSGESNRTFVTEVNPESTSHLNYEQRVQTTNSSALLAITKPDHVATNRPDAGQGSAITSSPDGADAVRSRCVTTNMGWSPLDMVQRHSPYRNFEWWTLLLLRDRSQQNFIQIYSSVLIFHKYCPLVYSLAEVNGLEWTVTAEHKASFAILSVF
jgi:hypothetical protein